MDPEPADPALANPALKEWAAVVRALRDGIQIVDLRKGGVREEGHRFRVRATRFWLYPGYEHQRRELIRPERRALLDAAEADAPAAGELRIDAWADIAAVASLTEPEQVAAIAGQHVWTPDYAAQRFRWRPKAPLLLLALRVHRLDEPLTAPVRGHYAGCASWTPMLDLPPDPRGVPSTPALGDAAFAERLAALRAALPGVPLAPPQAEGAAGV